MAIDRETATGFAAEQLETIQKLERRLDKELQEGFVTGRPYTAYLPTGTTYKIAMELVRRYTEVKWSVTYTEPNRTGQHGGTLTFR